MKETQEFSKIMKKGVKIKRGEGRRNPGDREGETRIEEGHGEDKK